MLFVPVSSSQRPQCLRIQTLTSGMQTAEERMAGLRRLLEDVKVESAKEGEASKELTSGKQQQ